MIPLKLTFTFTLCAPAPRLASKIFLYWIIYLLKKALDYTILRQSIPYN